MHRYADAGERLSSQVIARHVMSSTPAAALCFNCMQRMCPPIVRLKKECVRPWHLEPSRVLPYVKATRLFRPKIVQHLLSA
jgi:hypothetical protein